MPEDFEIPIEQWLPACGPWTTSVPQEQKYGPWPHHYYTVASKPRGNESNWSRETLLQCQGLIIHEGSSVYRIFKRWQAVNQQWKVLNYDKAKDLGEPLGGSTKPGGRNSRTNPSSGSERTSQRGQRVRTILNHHCGYTILHILSHLRPNEHRGGAGSSREVVMRVTTV